MTLVRLLQPRNNWEVEIVVADDGMTTLVNWRQSLKADVRIVVSESGRMIKVRGVSAKALEPMDVRALPSRKVMCCRPD